MKVLRKGLQGTDVRRWQYFLAGLGYPVIADGKFSDVADRYTKEFQAAHGLKADGEVGTFTYRKAIELGFNFQITDPTGHEETSLNWPPKPSFLPLSGIQSRFALFDKFDYRIIPGDPDGRIQILGNWEQQNIVTVEIPSLRNVSGAPSSGRIRFHKKAVPQLLALFQAWEQAGLIHLIELWSGSYYPRLVRGSDKALSNHSFGTAFDINVPWNGLNVIPPIVGKKGSVRALVPLANQFGFYWGGHFNGRLDGMHFEVARI